MHTFPPLLSSLYAVSHLSHEILLKSQENSNTGCVRWQRRGENNYRIKDGHFIQLGFFGLFPEDTFFFSSPCLWSDPQYEFPFLDGFAAHNDKPVPVGEINK